MTPIPTIFGPSFWLFRFRPAQASPLRGQPGLALQSKKIGTLPEAEIDTTGTTP